MYMYTINTFRHAMPIKQSKSNIERIQLESVLLSNAKWDTFILSNVFIFMLSFQFCIPNKKRNAPLRIVQLSGTSQVVDQFNLCQCKDMSGTAASHAFCSQASKLL